MPDISPSEINALRKLIGALAPSLALSLSEQLNVEVQLEMDDVITVPLPTLLAVTDRLLHTIFSLNQPTGIESVYFFTEETAAIMADMSEGNDGLNPAMNLSEAQVEKLSEMMSSFTRGMATALGNLQGENIEVESSTTHLAVLSLPPAFAMDGSALQAKLTLTIPDVTQAELCLLFTPQFVQEFAPDEPSIPDDSILSEDELAAMLGEMDSAPAAPSPAAKQGSSMPPAAAPYGAFPSANTESSLPRGMELILDIPLDVTVELGRMRMLIKDVLELASGSIVELDRVAGEPVDLLVNGRLIAKGEVVVIEDNFGIRITEIISPADRVAGLSKGR